MSALDLAYRKAARPVLFRVGHGDAETAHHTTLGMLSRAAKFRPVLAGLGALLARNPHPCTVFGVDFPSAVGLAAGMDKDGVAARAWPALGFGFAELGTVTALAQPGNEQPRLFRLRSSEAIINRMGFNNAGADALAQTLATAGPVSIPIGISLGKSKVTPVDEAVGDYLNSLRAVHSYADYIAVNVSSPNTPGLRTLQDRGPLDELLGALTEQAAVLAEQASGLADQAPVMAGNGVAAAGNGAVAPAGNGAAAPAGLGSLPRPTKSPASSERATPGSRRDGRPVPILVKIAPDLTDHAVAELLGVCADRGVAGVIATNTTLGRKGLASADLSLAEQTGGLSGKPLRDRALEVVRFVTEHTDLPVIGVGGISQVDDGLAMLDAGASLLQLYTGFIYSGPGLVTGLNKAIALRSARKSQ